MSTQLQLGLYSIEAITRVELADSLSRLGDGVLSVFCCWGML